MRKVTGPLVLLVVFVCGLLVGTASYAIIKQVTQIRNIGAIRAIGVGVYAVVPPLVLQGDSLATRRRPWAGKSPFP